MENIFFEKKEFRKKIKLQLSQLDHNFFVQKSEEICKNILTWQIYQKAKTILFYMPLKTEPNIFKVIEESFYQKKAPTLCTIRLFVLHLQPLKRNLYARACSSVG